MERNNRKSTTGKLPSQALLANPYVPYQLNQPEQYDARLGLVRGTLYPGLDLPFMGMVNKKPMPSTPMTNLQVLDFAIQELALYLDTHQEDTEALELYKRYQKLRHDHNQEYVRTHGPLCHKDQHNSGEYVWISDPWPWEYCGNKEV